MEYRWFDLEYSFLFAWHLHREREVRSFVGRVVPTEGTRSAEIRLSTAQLVLHFLFVLIYSPFTPQVHQFSGILTQHFYQITTQLWARVTTHTHIYSYANYKLHWYHLEAPNHRK